MLRTGKRVPVSRVVNGCPEQPPDSPSPAKSGVGEMTVMECLRSLCTSLSHSTIKAIVATEATTAPPTAIQFRGTRFRIQESATQAILNSLIYSRVTKEDNSVLSRRKFLGVVGTAVAAGAMPNMLARTSWAAAVPQGNTTEASLVDRARSLLRQAPFIETHNDLPSMLLEVKGDLAKYDLGKVQPKLCADIPRLREGGVGAQYWSVFVESATQKTHTSLHEAMREFDVALRMIRSQADFEQARTADDIDRIHKTGKIACLIGVEGGHMIENSAASLRVFYDLGARYMTLTHWDNIDWADAATDRPEHRGMTGFGKQVVKEMNRLGMFVDLSHVSAETMRDALSVTRAPVLFSHSSSFAVNPHPRNVPDDVLKRLPANGGVVHVNFIKEFISPNNQEWQDRRSEGLRRLHLTESTDDAITKAMQDWDKNNPFPTPTISDVADHID